MRVFHDELRQGGWDTIVTTAGILQFTATIKQIIMQPSFARNKALEGKAKEEQEEAARRAALHAPQYDLDGQSLPTGISLQRVHEVLPVQEVGPRKEHAKPP